MDLRCRAAGLALAATLFAAPACVPAFADTVPVLTTQGAAPPAAAEPSLAAHRALYTLTLANARGPDVTAATGKMAYEVIDACDGWAVRQRLDMTVTNRDGQDIQMVSDYTTFETKDGLNLRYRMRQTTETAVTSEVAGSAKIQPDHSGGEATYTLPEPGTKSLPKGTLLPMAHTSAIIAAAEKGEKFLSVPLFDGTSADGAQDSTITILGWPTPDHTKWKELAGLPSGRVHVAFFDRNASAAEPDYEVGMRYWSNGVADDLEMDFGNFVMSGKLTEFAPQKPSC